MHPKISKYVHCECNYPDWDYPSLAIEIEKIRKLQKYKSEAFKYNKVDCDCDCSEIEGCDCAEIEERKASGKTLIEKTVTIRATQADI